MNLYKLENAQCCDDGYSQYPEASLSDVQRYLAELEPPMVAVPLVLNQKQQHKIKLNGDYCMVECEQFYDLVIKAAGEG